MWQVLIVEDDAQMRAFFADSVRRCGQLALAGAVSGVAEALAWLQQPGQRVDVMLTDLGLPDGSGLDVIRALRRYHPQAEALVISMFGDEDNVLASIEAGASPISPMIARRVLSQFMALRAAPARAEPAAPPLASAATAEARAPLSPREQAVLELIARGFSYAEIARLHSVTVHTVQTHIKAIYSKLAVHSKSEAVFEATRMGLLPPRHFGKG